MRPVARGLRVCQGIEIQCAGTDVPPLHRHPRRL